MSSWSKITNAVLTSKWNKPFPVTLLPSAIGAYVAFYFAGIQGERQKRIEAFQELQAERQKQVLNEIRALSEGDRRRVQEIAEHPA
ncbi:hypothetical protein C1H76_5007 [Elsinoe australis]|uniref:Uncharacterized protein n=1 Tax=Elsinoe australis TaxID=40998 RepID=A0A4U7B0W3_9PEZI|nr:hypothetical protein C1H76_5007 [Elsinoe australis]